MEEILGLKFKMQGRNWIVSTKGIPGSYGVTCLETNAFISMSYDEIMQEAKMSGNNND
jgi:hypothetical protein